MSRIVSGSRSILFSQMFAGIAANQDATIPANVTVIYDVTSPAVTYGCLEISGTLRISQSVSTVNPFRCCEVLSGGTYECGTVASPYPRGSISHTIIPSGARSLDNSVSDPRNAIPDSNRGIMVMDGGTLSLVSAVPTVNIFKLGANANILDSSITAAVPVTLKAGDVLELTTTKYYTEGLSDVSAINSQYLGGGRRHGYGRELVTVASNVNNSTTIPISATFLPAEDGVSAGSSSATIQAFHHGKLQYIVAPGNEGISGTRLSYTNTPVIGADSFLTVNGVTISGTDVLAAMAAGAPSYIDNRATLGLMTHPIKVAAPNDSDWTTYGYGAHIMVMGNTGSKRMMQGVELFRCGQAGFLGRYPIHDHIRCYTSSTGAFLGDLDKTYNFTKQCSTLSSSNRANTVHGTCGIEVSGNVFVDTDTHAIFLEDGSEERNVIDGNLVSGVGNIRHGDNRANFTASITGNVMTVTAVSFGTIALGQGIYTAGYSFLAEVVAFRTGAGGTGTYTLARNADAVSQSMYSVTALKMHDIYTYNVAPSEIAGGAAGIWYTNPNNYLRNNIVSGAIHGIWNAFSHPYYNGYKERGTRVGTGRIDFTASTQHITAYASPVADQTITLTATSATTFTRTGTGGASGTVTIDTQTNHGSHTYIVSAGATPFQVGDTFIFDSKRFMGCFGLSKEVVLSTGNTYGQAPGWQDQSLQFYNNESSCCGQDNMSSGPFVVDEFGRTYGPNAHEAIGQRIPYDTGITTRFLIEKMNMWKGGFCNYQNESDHPWYKNWTVAGGRAGNTAGGGNSEMIQGNVNSTAAGGRPAEFDGCLFAPKTLDDYYSSQKTKVMVSYGGGINRINSIFISCPATTLSCAGGGRPLIQEDGSTMDLWDFYLYPINHHFSHDTNNVFIGSDPGYLGVRSPPIHMTATNFPATELSPLYTTITGSIRNPWAQGNSGAFKLPSDGSLFKRSGGWWIHNRPFLTSGTTSPVTAQSSAGFSGYNGKLVDSTHHYVGVFWSFANGQDLTVNSTAAVSQNFTRLQSDWVTPVTNGDWNFGPPDSSGGYAHMRHAALLTIESGGTCAKVIAPNGAVDIPTYPPNSISVDFLGFSASTQHAAFAVPFNHSHVIGSVSATDGLNSTTFAVASPNTLAGLKAMTSNSYWVDTANDLIYLHIWGTSLTNRYASDTYPTDRQWLNTWTVTVS